MSNLEWNTPSENAKHAYANGLNNGQPGESNSQAKLTKRQVQIILDMKTYGCSVKEIASMFQIHPNTVYKFSQGIRWKHLTKGRG